MTNDQRGTYQKSYLWKQAEWRLAWDRRFFLQDGLRLAYRVEENGPEKKVGYLISLLRDVDPQQPLVFRVWTKEGECWTLRAATTDLYRQWIDSLTHALLQCEAAEPDSVRQAVVLKKASWTGQWRERYFELDGCSLTYRSCEGDAVRRRYVLVAVDGSDEEEQAAELLFTTSCGERFWVKFATEEQCKDWKSVILRALRRIMPWQWLMLPPSAYETLHLLYRAYAKGSDDVVYFYGGSRLITTRRYSRTARMFLPAMPRETIARDLSLIQLSGGHKCSVLEVLPFEESAHAKVRPPPLMGAAICVLTLPSSLMGTKENERVGGIVNRSTSTLPLECLFLVGGRSSTCADRDAAAELWWCFPRSPTPQWHRSSYDASVFPHRTFHTLTARHASGEVLLIGGIDDSNRACADCFSISWGNRESEFSVGASPAFDFFGYLPEPRAFHVCLELQDSSLLLMGGQVICSKASSAKAPFTAAASVLRLSVGEKEWHEVSIHPSLPRMHNVCATEAFCEGEPCVFILGETCTPTPILTLFQLKLQSTNAISREIDITIGAIPRGSYGATMHYASGYLYVFGSCFNDNESRSADAPVPQDPVRMLIGSNSDDTHNVLNPTSSS